LPLTIAANPDVVMIQAITPVILACNRGDASTTRSIMTAVLMPISTCLKSF